MVTLAADCGVYALPALAHLFTGGPRFLCAKHNVLFKGRPNFTSATAAATGSAVAVHWQLACSHDLELGLVKFGRPLKRTLCFAHKKRGPPVNKCAKAGRV